MSALGRLVASVILDTAEFTVGTDKAKYLAASAATSIDKSFSDLEKGVSNTVRNIGVALAAGFSVNALKNQFDAFVSFRAELDKVKVTTGSAVEGLSVLGQAAKLANTDIGTVEAALIKMTKGLSASNAETKDTARALEYLGVSAKDSVGRLRDPGEVMLEIAKKLAMMEDGANKTAIALALWGKAGAQMLPTMRELAENGDLIAKVTTEQARQAHDYEVALTRLGIAMKAPGKLIMDELVVPLTALYKVTTDAITGADGLAASLKKLKEDGSMAAWVDSGVTALTIFLQTVLILGANVKFTFETIGKDIARAIENVQLIAKGDFAGSRALGEMFKKDAEASRAALDEWERRILKIGDAYTAMLDKIKTPPRESLRALEYAMANPPDPFKGTDHETKESAYKSENAELDKMIAKLKGVGELEAYITKLGEDRFAKLTPLQRQNLIDKETYLVNLKNEHEWNKLLLKSDEELLKARQSMVDLEQAYTDALRERVRSLEFDLSLLGKTTEQAAKLTELHKLDLDLQKQIAKVTSEADGDISSAQMAEIERLTKINAAAKEKIGILMDTGALGKDQLKVWDELSTKAGNFFSDLVMNGRSAFDRLRQEARNFAQEIIALFAKKFVLQMVAGLVGGTGGTALANSAASAGSGTLAGAGANAAGSFIGGAGTAIGGAYGAGEGFAMGWGSGVAGSTTLASGEVVGAGLAESAGAWMAGLGATGWGLIIVAAVAVLAAIFSKPGGAPKVGGSSLGAYDSTGAFISDQTSGLDRSTRLHDETQQDSNAAKIGQSIATSWAKTLTQLGGRSAGMQFGIGWNRDPGGDAPSMVSSMVRDASGREIFNQANRSVGRADNELTAEIQLQGERAVLAALKASELPEYLANVFNGMDAASATHDQIANAITTALALKDLFAVLSRNPMKDIATAVENSQNQFQFALKNNAATILAVAKAYDGSLASTQSLTAATNQYYSAQMQLMLGITQASQAIDDMFGATFRNIEMAGLDKQGKYDYLMREATDLQGQALGSSDPATIQRLASRINADINDAFNLLSPEEQRSRGGAFLDQGRTAQRQIDERLLKLQKDAADATKKTMDEMKEILKMNADKQGAAADSQNVAANTQLAAAQTPRVIVLQNAGGGQQVTTFGG